MQQTDSVNRFVLGMLAMLGAVLTVVGWYRLVS